MVIELTSASFGLSPPKNGLPEAASSENIFSISASEPRAACTMRSLNASTVSPSSWNSPPAIPPRPFIRPLPASNSVPAMSESAEPNATTPACLLIVSKETGPGSHIARRLASPLAFRLPRRTSNSPVHSSPTPPGWPRNAGVVAASNASVNHSGLSPPSMRMGTKSMPDSSMSSERRAQ